MGSVEAVIDPGAQRFDRNILGFNRSVRIVNTLCFYVRFGARLHIDVKVVWIESHVDLVRLSLTNHPRYRLKPGITIQLGKTNIRGIDLAATHLNGERQLAEANLLIRRCGGAEQTLDRAFIQRKPGASIRCNKQALVFVVLFREDNDTFRGLSTSLGTHHPLVEKRHSQWIAVCQLDKRRHLNTRRG